MDEKCELHLYNQIYLLTRELADKTKEVRELKERISQLYELSEKIKHRLKRKEELIEYYESNLKNLVNDTAALSRAVKHLENLHEQVDKLENEVIIYEYICNIFRA